MVPVIQRFSTFSVKNGKGIRNWKDKWVEQGRLCDLFPSVFKAVKNKDISIAEMVGMEGWTTVFKRALDANERLEWDIIRRDVAVPVLVEEDDGCSFLDNFSTTRCYAQLVGQLELCNFDHHVWKPNIPYKVSFILWASFHKSLPTRDMLVGRGVDVQSDLCVLCEAERETSDHLFIQCSYSFKVWNYFLVSWPMPGELINLFDAWTNNVLQGKAREVWKILHYAICWSLWNERNGRVFGARKKQEKETIDQVKNLIVLGPVTLTHSDSSIKVLYGAVGKL